MAAPWDVDEERRDVGVAKERVEPDKGVAVVRLKPNELDVERFFDPFAHMVFGRAADKDHFGAGVTVPDRLRFRRDDPLDRGELELALQLFFNLRLV